MDWSKFKEATEGIKNSFLIVVYGAGVFVFFNSVLPKIKDWEPKKGSFAGIEWGPKEKESQRLLDVSNVEVKVPVDSAAASGRLFVAAKTVDTSINAGTRNWVYLGQIINGVLKNNHWGLKEIPQTGVRITATDAVYKRKDLPIQLKNNDWKLGDIRGVVAGGETVKVLAVQKIEDENYWALVE